MTSETHIYMISDSQTYMTSYTQTDMTSYAHIFLTSDTQTYMTSYTQMVTYVNKIGKKWMCCFGASLHQVIEQVLYFFCYYYEYSLFAEDITDDLYVADAGDVYVLILYKFMIALQ